MDVEGLQVTVGRVSESMLKKSTSADIGEGHASCAFVRSLAWVHAWRKAVVAVLAGPFSFTVNVHSKHAGK